MSTTIVLCLTVQVATSDRRSTKHYKHAARTQTDADPSEVILESELLLPREKIMYTSFVLLAERAMPSSLLLEEAGGRDWRMCGEGGRERVQEPPPASSDAGRCEGKTHGGSPGSSL